MPLQLNFPDQFGHQNPQGYLRLEAANWTLGSGGLQISARIYADKAAADSGAKPVHEFSAFVPYDTTPMTGGIELAIAQRPEIASGEPTQVPA